MILTILKDRKTLITVPKAVKIDIYSKTDPVILKITTTKSNRLNGSAKYYHPNAISFISISVVNIPKKHKLEYDIIVFNISGDLTYCNINKIVLIVIKRKIMESKYL